MKNVPSTGEIAGLMPASSADSPKLLNPGTGTGEIGEDGYPVQKPNSDVLAQKSANPNAPVPDALAKMVASSADSARSAAPVVEKPVVAPTQNLNLPSVISKPNVQADLESYMTNDPEIAAIGANTAKRISFVDRMFEKFGAIWEKVKSTIGGVFNRN